MTTVRVGTSGWSYREWVGSFYPPGTPTARMLERYGRHLRTVEAHATYRRRPIPATVAAWAASVADDFRFAPKAHAAITHQRDLDGVEDRVTEFYAGLDALGDRLGPVLFQLPHRQPDLARLERLLAALPPKRLAAFELAAAWHVPAVVERIERVGATLVLVDTDAAPAPELDVGPFVYVRLRRKTYEEAQLDAWAARLEKLGSGGREVFAYVRHDAEGVAPRVASRLQEALA